MRGVFPHEPLDSVHDLLKLGNRHGYTMPDLHEGAGNLALATSPAIVSAKATEPAPSVAKPQRSSSNLVRDRSGNTHYIGPSGSLSFFAELRELVKARRSANNEGSHFVSDNTTQALEADGDDDTRETDHADQSPASVESILLKQFSGRARPDPSYLDQLPNNDTIEVLLESFFTNVHADFPLFHRATFQDEYEMYVVQPRHGTGAVDSTVSGPDWGWLACLHMAIVFGSIAMEENGGIDHNSVRNESLAAVTSTLPFMLSKCTLSNVQALSLQALFFHNNNERNAAWNLLGTAARGAIALGLHEIGFGSSFRPIQREIRKRVFCTLYSFEQFLSSSLGRPSGLHESDIDVSTPRHSFFDDDGFGDQYAMFNLRLQKLIGKTRMVLASLKAQASETNATNASATDLLHERKTWEAELPPHLRLPLISGFEQHQFASVSGDHLSFEGLKLSLSRQPPHQLRKLLTLHIQYHYIGLLISRPALLQDMASRTGLPVRNIMTGPLDTQQPSAEACEYHALQCALLLISLYDYNIFNGISALDIFYAYQAAMVLLLRLLKLKSMSLSSSSNGARDSGSEAAIGDVLGRLRAAISATRKCGTMKRFMAVVDKFAHVVMMQQPNPGDSRALRTQRAQESHSDTTTETQVGFVDQARLTSQAGNELPTPSSPSPWPAIVGPQDNLWNGQSMDMSLDSHDGTSNGISNPYPGLQDQELWFNPLDCLSDSQLMDWASFEAVFTT